jgi:hypothetical protein
MRKGGRKWRKAELIMIDCWIVGEVVDGFRFRRGFLLKNSD